MGSVFSGIGNVIGAPFGGISSGVANSAGATNNYQASNPYDQSVLQASVNQEGGLAQQLQAQAAGQGPSVSNTMLAQALQQQQAQAQASAAGQRGLDPGMAQRLALQQQGQQQANATAQGVVGRQQEQINAQGQLGNLVLGQQQLYNSANNNAQNINAGVGGQNAQIRGQLAGGLLNSAGGIGTAFAGAAHGGFIGGNAQTPGDSTRNDTVPTMLSPGEIVIPRSKSGSADQAKAFIDQLMKTGAPGDESYGKVAAAKKKASEYDKSTKKGR